MRCPTCHRPIQVALKRELHDGSLHPGEIAPKPLPPGSRERINALEAEWLTRHQSVPGRMTFTTLEKD